MIRNVESTVTFKIRYSQNSDVGLSECEEIERTVQQNIVVELPDEIVGLVQNLYWSKTLSLRIEIEGQNAINLKDATVNQGRLERRNSEVGRETPIYGKRNYPFWQFWHRLW